MQLAQVSTRAPEGFNKQDTKEETSKILLELDDLQNVLYAESKHSVLVILQGMDASGKDGVIRKVLGSLNPHGLKVTSFKSPTADELSHDFLWRVHFHAPAKGMIQVFNRSHYEDILITRVHNWIDDETVSKRIESINNFEKLLMQHNNTHILKFYLHISEEEQKERLNERLHNVKKQWKYNEGDFSEAKLWPLYREAYQDCFNKCNAAPWTIVPSDQNWYKEYLIAKTLLETLRSLDMQYPTLKSRPDSL